MDELRERLLAGGHSRAGAERVAAFVRDDPERFGALMALMLHDGTERVRQLAAYGLSVACDMDPKPAGPYVKDLLATLGRPAHEGVHRACVRMMQDCPLPKALHGRITQAMFALVADPAKAIALRAYAITVAMRMVELYPALGPELRLLLEEALRVDPGPAIRSRATKALVRLRRISGRGH